LTTTLIVRGVFDEAGDTGSGERSSRYLVVAGIVCDNLDPLRRVVARTRRDLHKGLRQVPEFKAWHTPPQVIARILNRLARLEIEIYAAILDKQSLPAPEDPEDWYRQIYTECIRLVLAQHPRVIVTLDRRYTKASLHDKLTRAIVSAQPAGTTLSFVIAGSRNEQALQTADVVAWSIFQKYTRNDEEYYRLIEEKISGETLVARQKRKPARPGG